MLTKEVMNGISSENLLGSKDLIYQPVMSMFSWAIPIQFLVGFPPELILVKVNIEQVI